MTWFTITEPPQLLPHQDHDRFGRIVAQTAESGLVRAREDRRKYPSMDQ
jgi:hypothetical protein